MGRWAFRVLGVSVLGLTATASWYSTTWDDLDVVEPAEDAAAGSADRWAQSSTSIAPNRTTSTTTTATTVAPPCRVADEPVEGDPVADWASVVVDAEHALPTGFAPPDLVDVAAAGFPTGDVIRQHVVGDLGALRLAAEANGTPIVLVSAFRSDIYQTGLFQQQVDQVGLEQAQRTTARPGHSEHQLGTTIDVLDPTTPEPDVAFAQTPTGQWLVANAHAYGFVLSYPDVSAERSCYEFEPWHLRYVGRDLAPAIHDSGLSLREWLLTH